MTTAIVPSPTRPPHGPPAVRQTLFDIGADLVELDNLIEELGGDVSDPKVEEAITVWFGEIAQAESDKLAGYVAYIRQLDMEAAAAEHFSKHFQNKVRTRDARIKWLKSRLIDYLLATKRTKATASDGSTVAVQKNGGKLPVQWDDEALAKAGPDFDGIHPKFVKTNKALDADAVYAALKEGVALPFAKLGEAGVHLRIR